MAAHPIGRRDARLLFAQGAGMYLPCISWETLPACEAVSGEHDRDQPGDAEDDRDGQAEV